MNQYEYPHNAAVSVRISKLFKTNEKRTTPDRVSSRMAQCASVMELGDFVGWQMIVPTKGLVKMHLFGTSSLRTGDLKWILEKAGKTINSKTNSGIDKAMDKLYEVYLPIAESCGGDSTIGFGRTESDEKRWNHTFESFNPAAKKYAWM